MDSLTQIVLGAAVGEAVLGKKIGNRAMLWGAIAGTIPDLDVFIKYFTDEITSTELHRGISHSLFFSIAMAPVLGWIAHKIHIKREPTFKNWSWLFFWSLVTHPLLDANTTWGTQFFWPFEYRLAYKNIFVADPLYTIPFMVFLIIAMCYKRTNPMRTRFNNIGLIVSSTYMLWSFVAKGIGYYQFQKSLDNQQIEYVELETKPTPLNTILWNAHVETETGFKVGYYSLFDSEKEIEFSDEFAKNHHLLEPYKEEKVVQQLIKISTGMYLVEKVDSGLIFTDIRFGQMGLDFDAQFPWRYLIQENNNTVSATRIGFKIKDGQMSKAFSQLGDRIKGN